MELFRLWRRRYITEQFRREFDLTEEQLLDVLVRIRARGLQMRLQSKDASDAGNTEKSGCQASTRVARAGE